MSKKSKARVFHFDINKTKLKPRDYGDVIELSSLTLEDCIRLNQSGYGVVIDNGQVIDLIKVK